MREQKKYIAPEIEVTRFEVKIPIMADPDDPGVIVPIPGEHESSPEPTDLTLPDDGWDW